MLYSSYRGKKRIWFPYPRTHHIKSISRCFHANRLSRGSHSQELLDTSRHIWSNCLKTVLVEWFEDFLRHPVHVPKSVENFQLLVLERRLLQGNWEKVLDEIRALVREAEHQQRAILSGFCYYLWKESKVKRFIFFQIEVFVFFLGLKGFFLTSRIYCCSLLQAKSNWFQMMARPISFASSTVPSPFPVMEWRIAESYR